MLAIVSVGVLVAIVWVVVTDPFELPTVELLLLVHILHATPGVVEEEEEVHEVMMMIVMIVMMMMMMMMIVMMPIVATCWETMKVEQQQQQQQRTKQNLWNCGSDRSCVHGRNGSPRMTSLISACHSTGIQWNLSSTLFSFHQRN